MQLQTKHFLIATAVTGLLLAAAIVVLSPLLQHVGSIRAAQQRIVNDFDHASIRDVATPLLAKTVDGFIEQDEWPTLIAETEPKYIHVANGVIFIEYGGGFLHYGLAIAPNNSQFADGTKLTDGVYFYDTE